MTEPTTIAATSTNGTAPARATPLDDIIMLGDEELAAMLMRIAAEQLRRTRLPKTPRVEDRTLDVDDIAKELGHTRRWVFRHFNAGKLPFIHPRVSRKSLTCYESDLKRWRATLPG